MSADTQLAYRADGLPNANAPTIILLHSLGSDRSMWAPQVRAWGGAYHVVQVDLPGHGASRGAPPATLEAFAQAVLSVADAVNAARFHVVGLSLGGLVALQIALLAPERVRSLSACNTAAKIASAEFWQARIETIHSQGMAALADIALARWFSPDFGTRHPDWLASAQRTFRETDPEGYIGCCRVLASADLRAQVAKISVPTLLVGGTHDLSTPAAEAAWLHGQIPGSELTVFEAAHLSNLDREPEFTARLLCFLRGH